jgi:Sulfotransferase domain
MAESDLTCVIFNAELIAVCSDAKILLTLNDDIASWSSSMMNTLCTGNLTFSHPTTILAKVVHLSMTRRLASNATGLQPHAFGKVSCWGTRLVQNE